MAILSAQVQAGWFMTTLCGGFCLGFCYDVCRSFLPGFGRRGVGLLWEGIFWLAAILAAASLLERMTGGEVRGYLFLGCFLGMGLYEISFHRLLQRLIDWLSRWKKKKRDVNLPGKRQ